MTDQETVQAAADMLRTQTARIEELEGALEGLVSATVDGNTLDVFDEVYEPWCKAEQALGR